MSPNKIILMVLVIAFLIVSLQSCYNVTTVFEAADEVTFEVSLTKDIFPIFNNSCNISGCHSAGGIKPDLSETNAYSALNNGGYLNSGNPAQSELYLWVSGQRAAEMPPGGPANPSNLNNLILAWINQGALNN